MGIPLVLLGVVALTIGLVIWKALRPHHGPRRSALTSDGGDAGSSWIAVAGAGDAASDCGASDGGGADGGGGGCD